MKTLTEIEVKALAHQYIGKWQSTQATIEEIAEELVRATERAVAESEPAPPAKKPWPISSVHVTAFSARWHIYDDAESLIAVAYSADQADALAHALNMYWPLVACLLREAQTNPVQGPVGQDVRHERDALLVECRAGGFEMPEVRHE